MYPVDRALQRGPEAQESSARLRRVVHVVATGQRRRRTNWL